ncbi:MAG: hypothetical protein ACI9OJ_003332 [Myxococcota bacterium]|jgi:hypothetical protein
MSTGPYDIIGDIHGQARSLRALLSKLGYSLVDGAYRHPERSVIFVGDFIDRGAFQVEVVELVRAMVDASSALAVMGNHEFNAIAYATRHAESETYLRPHSAKNTAQHRAFLDAFADQPEAYADTIAWFKTLPLWLEFDDLRIVHACWDDSAIAQIRALHGDADYVADELSDGLLRMASQKGTWQYEAIERLLKGQEIRLGNGQSFKDKDGHERHNIRVRWWAQDATTYRDAFMGPQSAQRHIPDDPIDGDCLVGYDDNAPPVFVGHYWMEGRPAPLAPNIACLDYSVAKPGGQLVAYRFDGESVLDREKFVWVDRVEP